MWPLGVGGAGAWPLLKRSLCSPRSHYLHGWSRGRGKGAAVWKVVGVVIPGSLAVYHMIKPLHHHGGVAYCKHDHTPPSRRVLPLSPLKSHDEDQAFNWSLFIKFILPDAILLLVAVGSAVVAALLNITIPLELGRLITSVSQLEAGGDARSYLADLTPSGTRLLALYLAQAMSTLVYITVLSISGERLARRLREGLFTSLLQQDISFFDTHKTGELVGRLSGDVQELKSSFKMVISQGLRGVTQVLGCVASLYLISPQMTGVVGVALPVMVVIGTVMGSVLRRWSRKAQEQVAIATGVADEAISNVRTVRSFAMEENEERLYQRELRKASHASSWLGVGVAVFQGLSNLAINSVILVVVGHGGLLLASNQVSPGNLMAFLVATQTIQRSLASLSVLFGQVVRGLSAGARVFEFMEACPDVALKGGVTLPLNSVRGDITFEKVSFSYPSRPDQQVLNELTLSVPAGKVTALCGLSGAGKSTIAGLLERFYEPDGGVVRLDGSRLLELDPSWLRGKVLGYISQEPVLFACSVMENIRYGRPSASDEEVKEVAKMAYAHQFISDFPEGYSTLVGERGVALSGGQKQRVAIARALLKNPPILILDEATSALDAQSEELVQQALEVACRGRTVLIIAHRLSTICEADQIAVLHKGKLEEVGTHQQLLARNGLYKELIRRQRSLN